MTCQSCKKDYDASKVVHIPVEIEESRGMMTMRTATGTCKEVEKS